MHAHITRHIVYVFCYVCSQYNLVWKGVRETQYWFWLALYNGSYEWTIDNAKDDVLRYCTLTNKQQQELSKEQISYIYPYSCDKWNKHNPKTKESEPLPHMEVFDCDIYSIDELLEFIVTSTGKTASVNADGQIVIDTDTNVNHPINKESETENARDSGWDLRYIDLVYIVMLSILAYFVFEREQNFKRTRLYQAIHEETDNEM